MNDVCFFITESIRPQGETEALLERSYSLRAALSSTLEITRLRASKTTRKANAPPQAQPTSKKRRIAIRVH
jgi:hypothetical protein